MDPQRRALGPATTRFTDYVGTVAADDAEAVRDRPNLYELAQIDRDRYTIVGIELNVDDPTTAAVYAFDRSVHSVARLEQIVELGLSRGEIPVIRFDIPDVDAGDFIRHAFRRISVRLVIQASATSPSWSANRIQHRPTSAAANRFEHRSLQTQMPRHHNYLALTSRVTVQLSRQDCNASAILEPTNTSSDAPAGGAVDGPSNRSPSHGSADRRGY
jgi:hypothetical protein